MAFSHGTLGVFKIADSGSTLRDISTYINQAGLARTVEAAEVTALGKTAKVYIPGLSDATIPIEGKFDPTVDGYLAGILRAMSTWEYYPVGEPAGATKPKYSGACMLTNYEITTGVNGAASIRGTIQCSDTITRAVA